MKIALIIKFIFLVSTLLILPGMGDAANQILSIRNVNTYVNSQSRIMNMREILYSSPMQFDFSKLAINID